MIAVMCMMVMTGVITDLSAAARVACRQWPVPRMSHTMQRTFALLALSSVRPISSRCHPCVCAAIKKTPQGKRPVGIVIHGQDTTSGRSIIVHDDPHATIASLRATISKKYSETFDRRAYTGSFGNCYGTDKSLPPHTQIQELPVYDTHTQAYFYCEENLSVTSSAALISYQLPIISVWLKGHVPLLWPYSPIHVK